MDLVNSQLVRVLAIIFVFQALRVVEAWAHFRHLSYINFVGSRVLPSAAWSKLYYQVDRYSALVYLAEALRSLSHPQPKLLSLVALLILPLGLLIKIKAISDRGATWNQKGLYAITDYDLSSAKKPYPGFTEHFGRMLEHFGLGLFLVSPGSSLFTLAILSFCFLRLQSLDRKLKATAPLS